MKTVTVIGEGAWGTAVSTLLAHNGNTVLLWCHDEQVKKDIEKSRYNERYLPGVKLSKNIIPVLDLNKAIEQSAWIFEAIPVKYLRSIISKIDPAVCNQKPWVILSKGIEVKTHMLPSEIIDSELKIKVPQVIFFGPSFAHDLAHQHITAVTLACKDPKFASSLQNLLINDYFKVTLSIDPFGVQLCGGLKNVVALIVGMVAGAGYGDNTKAFLITQGLHEMAQLVTSCGGMLETVYGLAGIGDLVLTSLSHQSRNVKTGYLLGQGKSLDLILQETGMIPEGVTTLVALHELIKKKKIKAPLFEGIYAVIYDNEPLKQFLQKL